ncbi:MAG: aminotransferase class III-fold pyridoxal phosphate-dependent enzyme, partial [Calditrichaeota bacterium]|nr:aminotransferase class III-fold pyridoxal phosphate-dependent enzyme [Calditrichota bacterium]
ARLNTNTRYLHSHLLTYAEQLTATLPDKLSVCYFVNSGSEANDLALRLARNYTQAVDMIVLDHAYHGHTEAVIELSPYKFDGKGGKGAEPFIHKALAPDNYRGEFKGKNTAKKYAQSVANIIKKLDKPLAGFIAESILSCGGQILLPNGYLSEVYQLVHEAGGVCIADEVQVGFGRVGQTFWAFELQDVVPDIVTMGKPIGNGHPLAAVITTKEIAKSFDNGMEYFNTFGGNPVSAAAGLAVLDVIESENLQSRALENGNYLLNKLEQLKKKHKLIGDVRGTGLFIGIEFVRDQNTLEADPLTAKTIVEFAKEKGILLSTDGPLHNVIKIKPPLCFSRKNADQVSDCLDAALSQVRP